MQKKETNILLLQVNGQLNLQKQSKIDNQTIIRFLTANNNNIQTTVKIIKEYFVWIQKLQNETRIDQEQIKQLKNIYPHGYAGMDTEGHPIIIDQIGKIKMNQLFKFFQDNKLINYLFQRMEYLTRQILKKTAKKQIVVILDLNGPIMKMASKRVYNLINSIVSLFQKFYPGILHKLYFVNTPILFETSWNFIKQGISKETLQKINMIGSDFQQQLLKTINKSNLPEFLGGDLKEEDYLLGNVWEERKYGNSRKSSSSEQQQQNIDFSSLKAALTNIIPKNQSHGPIKGIADTPVNTQSDQKN